MSSRGSSSEDTPGGVVRTERMLLRPLEEDDLGALASVFAHPEVWQYPYGRAFTRDETHRFLTAQRD